MERPERRRRWRVGLALQIDAIVAAVVLVLGGVLGWTWVGAAARQGEEALDARVRLLGGHVAAAAELPWARGDAAALDALLRGTVLDPEVAYVLLRAPDGEVRAARWVEVGAGVRERTFPIRAPLEGAARFGENPPATAAVGTVAIGVDLAPLAAARRKATGQTVAAVLLGAVIAVVLGHVLVVLLLHRATAELLRCIRALGAGRLDHRIRLRVRTAELAEIGRAFDEMAERLSSSLVSRAALEDTVAARTSELTRAIEEGGLARAALADREERVRLLLDSTAEAIIGMDLSGRCTFANPAAARLLGYRSPAELEGQAMHGLAHHSRPDGSPLPDHECAIQRALRDGREYHSDEETLWRADGRPLPVEFWSYPTRREGRLVGSVITFLDVTERRRMEAELVKMKKLESLGVLAGGIAHDFNNLLTGILGNLSLAREQVRDGEPGELLEEAELASKRARALTQQLLTFSKGGAPVKKVLSLRSVVDDAATFALRGSACRGAFAFADGLWPVEADAGQLAQVVQNLVINASQAMPQGGTVEIACDNAELAAGAGLPLPPGRYVRVTVRDHGTGIAPEHLPRIFDPYFTTKQAGSGLGLATVYAIVRKHGGHVAVESALGRGTTFQVVLPASARAAGADAAARAPAASRRGRVLVMDDDAVVRSAATGMLRSFGYDVIAATDGREAIALFEEARRAGHPVAVALVDLTVPGGMGGVEALARLRAIDPAVRAVASSGYSNDPVMAAYADYGFASVLPKPYTLEDLARALDEALSTGPAPPRPAARA